MDKIKIYIIKTKKFLLSYFRLILVGIISILLFSTGFISIYETNKYNYLKQPQVLPYKVNTLNLDGNNAYINISGLLENKNKVVVKSIVSGIVGNLKIEKGKEISLTDPLVEIHETYSGNKTFEKNKEIYNSRINEARNTLKYYEDIKSEIEDIEEEKLKELNEYEEFKEDKLVNMDEEILKIEAILEDIQSISSSSNSYPPLELLELQTKLNNLKEQREILDYETSSKYSGGKIAKLEKKLALEKVEYDIQAAKLSLDIVSLELELFNLQVSLRTISSPIAGSIEDIYVKHGDYIQQGQDLFMVNGKIELGITLYIIPDLVNLINKDGECLIKHSNKSINCDIDYIASAPNDNNLYSIDITPDKDVLDFSNLGSYISVSLPIASQQENADENSIFVPIDSIKKSGDDEYILTVDNGVAKELSIISGRIIGHFIEITSGLEGNEVIILDRNIISGQKVELSD